MDNETGYRMFTETEYDALCQLWFVSGYKAGRKDVTEELITANARAALTDPLESKERIDNGLEHS